MAKDKMYGKTLRKNFARHEEIMEMPNLLELQKKSYRWFLDEGLQEVFTDVASITNYAGNLELSFIGYKMDEAPKCPRCWNHHPSIGTPGGHPELCPRCAAVVRAMGLE